MTKWIIEHIFTEDERGLIEAIKRSGVEYHILSNPIYEGQWEHLADENGPVVTYGSIQFGELVKNTVPEWKPGHIWDAQQFLCTSYYPHFGKKVLNYNHVMMPFGDIPDKLEILFKAVGIDDAIFVRPDSGDKLFTGRLVYRENFDHDYEMMGLYGVEPSSLCLICEPRNVVREWRFFVIEGQVATGSLYRPHKVQVRPRDSIWKQAQGFVDESGYNPGFIWCLDLCETAAGNVYVLETGSFSSAGLYDCDTNVIVDEVNRLAEQEFLSCMK